MVPSASDKLYYVGKGVGMARTTNVACVDVICGLSLFLALLSGAQRGLLRFRSRRCVQLVEDT